MPLPETPLHPGSSPEVIRLLDEVQGHVLAPHRFDQSAHLFLDFAPGAEAEVRRWFGELANANRITSMNVQLARASGEDQDFLSVMVSHAGARKLGWGDRFRFPAEFEIGMHDREETLVLAPHDPQVATVAKWQKNFQVGPAPRLDAHVLLAGRDLKHLERRVADFIAEAAAGGKAVLRGEVEWGRVVRQGGGRIAVEHFGFADGISNPQFVADEVAKARRLVGARYWDPLFPLSQVLFELPDGHGGTSYGSYFVFRKIEQHVRAFADFERRVRDARVRHGLPAETDPGSVVVGRDRSGHPLSLPDDRGGTPGFNDFTYGLDRQGAGCPFHAHVRKSNPRRLVRENSDPARDHLFPRRGMLYGERAPDFSDEPVGEVGLLFMAYMADIEQQFEHVLRNWSNDPDFPGNQDPGVDSLIGEPPAATIPLREHGRTLEHIPLARFVTPLGGEYFFVPPLSWLRDLGESHP